MKQSINEWDFIDAFKQSGRADQFSTDALRALFNWIEELDADCGTETELDVIALCCEFTEYADLAEIQSNYDSIESMDDLHDNTMVIEFDGGIIIQDF